MGKNEMITIPKKVVHQAAAALVLAVVTGTILFNSHSQGIKAYDGGAEPVISTEARVGFEEGKLSKSAAVKKINKRLSELVITGEIEKWNYNEDTGEYNIVFSNGTKFGYTLTR
ncbi:hypothetical protein bpr_II386 (plasmid) [Butyrivibrio proteoclasticus B316]|uniref:Uncharacterized protein n=1 Tax=Butyrivibrio proteoclasticus (strain ATCC 51982 / DSM 14932 / B316) TaxID=515622 RepID=E0S4J1_BUTPB|nr:hypothetical protein [Butyrivibrio proteoclasticus]ADL36323.1 hypothetical protein bpr_II386 [Butyrivibrio proteoclasticus B316]